LDKVLFEDVEQSVSAFFACFVHQVYFSPMKHRNRIIAVVLLLAVTVVAFLALNK